MTESYSKTEVTARRPNNTYRDVESILGRVTVICCTKYKDRMVRIKREMSRVGLDRVYYDVQIPSPFDTFMIPYLPCEPELGASHGWIWCTMAHYRAIKRSYELDEARCTIVEDDMRFLKDVDKLYKGILSAPDGAELLMHDSFPGFLQQDVTDYGRRLSSTSAKINDTWVEMVQYLDGKRIRYRSGGCYTLGRRAMKRLIGLYESCLDSSIPNRLLRQVDHWWDWFPTGGEEFLPSYFAYPNLAIQREFPGKQQVMNRDTAAKEQYEKMKVNLENYQGW